MPYLNSHALNCSERSPFGAEDLRSKSSQTMTNLSLSETDLSGNPCSVYQTKGIKSKIQGLKELTKRTEGQVSFSLAFVDEKYV